jgi:hypothetical protein
MSCYMSMRDFKHHLRLWIIERRLAALEALLYRCIADPNFDRSLQNPKSSQLHLVLKATCSARIAISLLRRDFRQESEAPQRAFLEAWTYAMHFTWFPGSSAFNEWQRRPDKPLNGGIYDLKSEIEAVIDGKLDFAIAQQLPVRRLFKVFSNVSIHPTRNTVERSFEDAARRSRLAIPNLLPEIHEPMERLLLITKTITTFVQLHLFFQFLRRYVLIPGEVADKFALANQSTAESIMKNWLTELRPQVEFAFRVADEGYGTDGGATSG